jgi:prophage regulatory protein
MSTTLPRLLRLPEVLKLTGLSKAALYRATAAGTFPKPVKLTERSSAWVAGEVETWILQRIESRSAA